MDTLGGFLRSQEARVALGFFRAQQPPVCIHLTNRVHVAVRLFSNRSQMTSKCGKNKEVAHEPQASVSLGLLWDLNSPRD